MTDAQTSDRSRAATRIALGFAQGIALWIVTRGISSGPDSGWLHDHPPWFIPLLITFGLAPMVVLAGLGQMRRRTLWLWTAIAAALLFAAGWWIGWKASPEITDTMPLPFVIAPVAVALFIAHHLIAVADEHGGWKAPYPTYFELASKHLVQLGLSVAFTGAFWILLMLGSALFGILGIKGFGTLISQGWFAWPATTTVFATAVALTDVRTGLVQGVRTLGLTLLSWLTPLMAAIAAAFLASMVFTGLKPLFDTGNAAEIVSAAAAALIVLINATYQDGQAEEARPLVLRWGVRLASVLLVPLVGVAAYALYLRVGQHGLTPERVYALAFVVAAAAFAIGYAWAAVRPGSWMKGLERTNVLTGYFALAVLALILSPILDPQRVSVSDQLARLHDGRVAADKFDYNFLRFGAGRIGVDALKILAAAPSGPHADRIASQAKAALDAKSRFDGAPARASDIAVFPAGRTIPPEILQGKDGYIPCSGASSCVAVFSDFDGDGAEDVVLAGASVGGIFANRTGHWVRVGLLSLCPGDVEAIAKGGFALKPSRRQVLEVAGRRLEMINFENPDCPGQAVSERLDTELVKPPPPSPSPSAPRASTTPPAKAPPAGR